LLAPFGAATVNHFLAALGGHASEETVIAETFFLLGLPSPNALHNGPLRGNDEGKGVPEFDMVVNNFCAAPFFTLPETLLGRLKFK